MLHEHVAVGGAADTEVVPVGRLDELVRARLHAADVGPADELLARAWLGLGLGLGLGLELGLGLGVA